MKSLRMATLTLAILGTMSVAGTAQFAQVVNGPNTTNACPGSTPPVLIVDKLSNVVSSCGTSGTAQAFETAVATFGAKTAVTTVTTAQTMASVTMTAGLQNFPTRTLRICGSGIYTTPGTTTPAMTILITEGGITPVSITTAALSATASTNMPFQFCFNITTGTLGATGTVEAHGRLTVNVSDNTPAAAAVSYLDTNTAVSSALNLNAANTLAVKVSADSAISSVQLRQLTVELIS